MKAKNSLEKCYKYNPNNDILKELSPLIIKIDEEYDKAVAKEKQRILAEREAQRKKLEQEKQEALKKSQLTSEIEPQAAKQITAFENLVEGKIYIYKPDKNITSSSSERSFFVFYGDKYLIIIVPSFSIASLLTKVMF